MNLDASDTQKKRARNQQNAEEDWEDVDDKPTQPRKIVKTKKNPGLVATGTENNSDIEFEDSQDDEFEQENIVQNDEDSDEANDDWESESSDDDMAGKKQSKQPVEQKIWNDQTEPLKEDEELEYDGSAYQMLHRSKVEWPCLSIDWLLKERCGLNGVQGAKAWFPAFVNGQLNPEQTIMDRNGLPKHRNDKFPLSVYMVAGSQADKKSDNKLYVMKWSEMYKTDKEDEVNSDMDSDEENEKFREPVIRFETVPHRGAVNRIRSMHGSPIVATWNEDCEVGIYNITQALEEVEKPTSQKKQFGGCKISSFKHKAEGFALDWSPLTYGRLASGSCDSQLWLYQAADETCSAFVKETAVGLQGHKGSIEDIQWSPTQENILATCSCDQTIKLWDLRATQQKPQISWLAHDCDVNVISWNTQIKFLLASGDDKGEFRIWDLRMLQGGASSGSTKKDVDSITRIRWHTSAITSIQFEPREDSVLAVSSADNKLTLWDFSVEVDESETVENADFEIPPQLMFLHQGQTDMKEIRFHPQFKTLIVSTAGDSFNVFRPNLEPEEDEEPVNSQEESKQEVSTTSSVATKKTVEETTQKMQDVWVDSDEDEQQQEERAIRTVRQLNKNRRSKSKQKNQSKRSRLD